MRSTVSAMLAFAVGLGLASASPTIDGRITGSWDGDFFLYAFVLLITGFIAGLIEPRRRSVPPAAAFTGQAIVWTLTAVPDPLVPLGFAFGLMQTLLTVGGGAWFASALRLRNKRGIEPMR